MNRSQTSILFVLFFSILFFYCPRHLAAGVVNPDISVLGQITAGITNDPASENKNKPVLNLGETEIVFDSYLNPYARGTFVFSISEAGLDTEEAYMSIIKGLPLDGLALKGGKYRLGFGRLNPAHPHTYSFVEAPRVISAMLPGEDGFNDIGAQASFMLPTVGSWASILSADAINGSSFHPEETESALGWLGRWNNSFLVKDTVPLEIGLSGTQGTNNVEWGTKTNVYGVDIKTKIPITQLNTLVLQAEYFYNISDVVADPDTGEYQNVKRYGYYAFFDYKFATRWNGGVIFDAYQPRKNKDLTNKAVKAFLGYSLMEETTLFRLTFERFYPAGMPKVNTVSLQVLFSMVPHKAHQF